ncbi:MAG: lamin tail domain-containing protein, partial [Flavobacteriales bacterium]
MKQVFLFIFSLSLSFSAIPQSLSNLDFGNDNTFDVITWNLENFPKIDGVTENYVSEIILELHSEIIGFQEISDINAFLTMMSSTNGYTGYVANSNYGSLDLAYAVKNDVTVIDHYKILSTSNYNYAFAGRSPFLIHVEKNNVEYYVINVHLKCCGDGTLNTSNSSDEEYRRFLALSYIKNYIDTFLDDKNVFVIGDFNDELNDEVSNNVFQNFIDDTDYQFVDMNIANGNSQNFSFPSWPSHIDHILITNELFDELNTNLYSVSTIQIANYFNGGFSFYDSQITDHMPVGVSLPYSSECLDSLDNSNSCQNDISNDDAPNIFISEYAEGSSYNKYLEIYNPTSSVVSLDDFAIAMVVNSPDQIGVYDSWHYFDLGSTIEPDGIFIIAHPSSNSTILSQANMTTTHFSNGDDGIALVFGNQPQVNSSPTEGGYTVIDRVGDWNGDPGSGWQVAGIPNATKDHTLKRKCSVAEGNPNWIESAGTTEDNSEWIILTNNDWSDIGQHYFPCEYTVQGCTDPSATNYNTEATEDDGSCDYPVDDPCDAAVVPTGLVVDNIIHNRVV